MLLRLRVAIAVSASLMLSAAGDLPEPATPAPVIEAVFTPEIQPLIPAEVVEDETIAASGSAVKPQVSSLRQLVSAISDLPSIDLDEQTRCLAVAVYFESKGEPLDGQLAVAQVVLNRVASGRWSDSICGAVYQRGQFSFTWDKRSDNPPAGAIWDTAKAIAVIAASADWRSVVPKATHFHATRVSPGWGRLTRIATVGNHVFYR